MFSRPLPNLRVMRAPHLPRRARSILDHRFVFDRTCEVDHIHDGAVSQRCWRLQPHKARLICERVPHLVGCLSDSETASRYELVFSLHLLIPLL